MWLVLIFFFVVFFSFRVCDRVSGRSRASFFSFCFIIMYFLIWIMVVNCESVFFVLDFCVYWIDWLVFLCDNFIIELFRCVATLKFMVVWGETLIFLFGLILFVVVVCVSFVWWLFFVIYVLLWCYIVCCILNFVNIFV